jgi:molybdopterin-guanine dinucleotide biosynthesis adapter protein
MVRRERAGSHGTQHRGHERPVPAFGLIPIVSVVGRTNSGKTTLIEKLIPALSARGYRIATIKHHHHGDFEVDQPGKDSWRHARAGAVATALAGNGRLAIFQRLDAAVSPDDIARLFVEVPDFIVTEGYQQALFPKVEVIRVAQNLEPLCRKEDQLIALVTDGNWELGVPRFGLTAVEELAQFLADRFLTGD